MIVALPGLVSASMCSAVVTLLMSSFSLPLGLVVGLVVSCVVAACTTGLVPEYHGFEYQWFANTFVVPVVLQRVPVESK